MVETVLTVKENPGVHSFRERLFHSHKACKADSVKLVCPHGCG